MRGSTEYFGSVGVRDVMDNLQGFHVERGCESNVNGRGYSQVSMEVFFNFRLLRPRHFDAIEHEIIPVGDK